MSHSISNNEGSGTVEPHELEAAKSEIGESKRPDDGTVHELSVDFLKHMVEQHHSPVAKFIRIGNLILVGTASRELGLQHRDFLNRVSATDDEVRAKIANAQTVANLNGKHILDHLHIGIQDAGAILVGMGEGDEIKLVKIMGESGNFGMADEQGRDETVRIAQQVLGDNIPVEQ